MKFQATSLEYWSQNQVETIFFGNAEKGFALLLSNVPGTADHYLEWNDQSNACVNGVEKIELSGEALHIQLVPKAADQIGETEFSVEFECDKAIFEEVTRCLKLIFQKKLLLNKTAPKKEKATQKQDYSKIRYLNLEGKNLKKLPDHVSEMTAVETAKLARNPKLDFHAVCEVLATFPNLKELSFSTEGGIPENLGKLTQLETLSITDLTKPCAFPESVGQLKKLKYLLVMGNSEVILPESFAELTELEALNMRVESWELPARFYQLSKLKSLDFSNCRFTQVAPEMAQMTEVSTVIFSNPMGQDFSQILPIVAQMPNLKTLELSVNPVPKEVGLCKNIEELIIWAGTDPSHPLQLPDELFELTQLQTLIMSLNYFEKIPEGIGKLKGLKTLALQESVFESLPDSIGELSSLEMLNLSENPSLKSVPDSLGKLTQLHTLHLDETPQLTELPLSLKNLTNLIFVSISNRETLKNVPENWNRLLTSA
jgi:Leucine-rich repeat (LRR) protein